MSGNAPVKGGHISPHFSKNTKNKYVWRRTYGEYLSNMGIERMGRLRGCEDLSGILTQANA